MLPRELYAPAADQKAALGIAVGYIDGGLTREEIWCTECESDAPREHRRRVSPDNGRTWSGFESLEAEVNQQRPDGGIASQSCGAHFDRHQGILYRVVLRRLWPGMKLYTYDWHAGEHPFNDHVFIVENGHAEKLMAYESGPGFRAMAPFEPDFCLNNRAYPGSGMAFGKDGTAYYPIVTYKPGKEYSFNRGGVRLMRRDPASGQWLASEPQYVTPAISSRGLLEPDVAVLGNGNLLVVCRGSNTPQTPGRKWMCVSGDGGRTLSAVEELRYDDGTSFYSPSSIHRFFRSARNGKLYWVANIVSDPPQGNGPRYPLCLAEIDEKKPAVIKDSVLVIDDRRPEDAAELQLSNWSQLENRETLDWEFYLSRIGQDAKNFWASGVYRYIFAPP